MSAAPIRTLRTNGELVEKRSVSMAAPFRRNRGASLGGLEVDGLRAFAALVRLDVEGDALAFAQGIEARPGHRRDVHEYVAAAVVGAEEPKALFLIEELHDPGRHFVCSCRRDPPT